MPKRQMPRGGRYTRPRRGFRVKSHYRDRLKKRGLRNSDVRMESIYALRKRQGIVPGYADSDSGTERLDFDTRMESIYALRKRQGIVPGYADSDSGTERLDTDFWDSETDL